jgi:hypothetical protein
VNKRGGNGDLEQRKLLPLRGFGGMGNVGRWKTMRCGIDGMGGPWKRGKFLEIGKLGMGMTTTPMIRILRDAGGGIADPEVEKSHRGRKGVEKMKKKIKQSYRQSADEAIVVPAPIAHEADLLAVVAMGRTSKTGENDHVWKTHTSTRIAPKVAQKGITINLGDDDDQSLRNMCWMIYEKPQVLSCLLRK